MAICLTLIAYVLRQASKVNNEYDKLLHLLEKISITSDETIKNELKKEYQKDELDYEYRIHMVSCASPIWFICNILNAI
jgi:hypothetical protein